MYCDIIDILFFIWVVVVCLFFDVFFSLIWVLWFVFVFSLFWDWFLLVFLNLKEESLEIGIALIPYHSFQGIHQSPHRTCRSSSV